MKSVKQQILEDCKKYLKANINLDNDSDFLRALSTQYDRSLKTCQNLMSMARKEVTIEKPYKVAVSLSDTHIPFEDKKALKAIEQFLRDVQPEELVLNGDFIDSFSISRFLGDPRKPRLQEELDQAKDYLKRWSKMLPDTKITYLAGNHCVRIDALVADNPGLVGLDALRLENLLELPSMNIDYYEYMEPYQVGEFTFVHGTAVSKHAGYAAKRTCLDKGFKNFAQGHTHRMGYYSHTGHEGVKRAFEQGHLSDASQADYIKGTPNWLSGFLIVTHDLDDRLLDVNLVEIIDDRFIYNGIIYGGQ